MRSFRLTRGQKIKTVGYALGFTSAAPPFILLACGATANAMLGMLIGQLAVGNICLIVGHMVDTVSRKRNKRQGMTVLCCVCQKKLNPNDARFSGINYYCDVCYMKKKEASPKTTQIIIQARCSLCGRQFPKSVFHTVDDRNLCEDCFRKRFAVQLPEKDQTEKKEDDMTIQTTAKNPEAAQINDRILGCLVGGAAGDALGYAVEFMRYDRIVRKYGKDGITAYSLDPTSAKALISDDTQMTLFTAEGLLVTEGSAQKNIYDAYQNWYVTQTERMQDRPRDERSELLNRPEMYALRAPGNTCMSALASRRMGTVTDPINSSKGCGGVMRVAPIAFLNGRTALELDKLAAQAAASTHGHPLGFLPAALLVHILHMAIFENDGSLTLRRIVDNSVQAFSQSFSAAPRLDALLAIVDKAVSLSGNDRSDIDNITELGEGWVADETLAIALYCTLRHSDDFSAALTASVNHNGDSDSTGAVAGNILGAYLGSDRIDAQWKDRLELYDLLVRTAEKFYL